MPILQFELADAAGGPGTDHAPIIHVQSLKILRQNTQDAPMHDQQCTLAGMSGDDLFGAFDHAGHEVFFVFSGKP